jgi:hypothetical protein
MNCPNCGAEYQVVFSGQTASKPKRVSTMSAEDRKAVGIRLQTARAAKIGLTLDQLKALKDPSGGRSRPRSSSLRSRARRRRRPASPLRPPRSRPIPTGEAGQSVKSALFVVAILFSGR